MWSLEAMHLDVQIITEKSNVQRLLIVIILFYSRPEVHLLNIKRLHLVQLLHHLKNEYLNSNFF